MIAHALLTAVGNDRVGIVDDIAAAIFERKCNIEESRMALLGGDFAVLLLLSGHDESVARLRADAEAVGAALGLSVTVRATESPRATTDALPYILESSSLDTSGIVHAVAAVLRGYGINIDDMETETSPAPWTGAPLFNMKARLAVPRAVSIPAVRRDLEILETDHNLDLRLYPAGRSPSES